jgi:DNA-binding transcriptional regulator YiaG
MTDKTTETTTVVKTPSKKSLATAIFQAKMVERSQGLFGANKEFRSAVLVAIETELGVSRASASTMYNTAKKEAEAADPKVGLGRDPKKVKAPSTGKRGRPVGSKNKAKAEVVAEPVAEAVA